MSGRGGRVLGAKGVLFAVACRVLARVDAMTSCACGSERSLCACLAGTRLSTRYTSGRYQLTGTASMFVSYKLSDQPGGATAPFSNAGVLPLVHQQLPGRVFLGLPAEHRRAAAAQQTCGW